MKGRALKGREQGSYTCDDSLRPFKGQRQTTARLFQTRRKRLLERERISEWNNTKEPLKREGMHCQHPGPELGSQGVFGKKPSEDSETGAARTVETTRVAVALKIT